MIDIIGVPFDKGGTRPGSAIGPSALRYAGLVEALESLDLSVRDCGDLVSDEIDSPEAGLNGFESALAIYKSLKSSVARSLSEKRLPIVLGGDHSISIGSVAAACDHAPEGVRLLWIDAHADLNVPGTSPSGNLHGMPIAALMARGSQCEGVPDEQWNRVQNDLISTPLKREHVAWIGLREVDLGEQEIIAEMPRAFATTMQDIDELGMMRVIDAFDEWMAKGDAKHLWVSFDVDSLDPILAPGTGTTVRGGLTYREGHLLAERLNSFFVRPNAPYQLLGIDIVETNPVIDRMNETARIAVEWAASLFGKRILNVRSPIER